MNYALNKASLIPKQKQMLTFADIITFYINKTKNIASTFSDYTLVNLAFNKDPNKISTAYGNHYYLDLQDERKQNLTILCPKAVFEHNRSFLQLDTNSAIDIIIDSIFLNKQGRLLIKIKSFTENGISALAKEKRRIEKYCIAHALFSRQKKKLPKFINKIAIITTKSSYVESDIINQIGLAPRCITVFKCESSAVGIQNQLKSATIACEFQLVVLFRGGNEDASMIYFSHESVLKTIENSPIPVVSAIGHESDSPIVDKVADLHFSTPSSFAKAVYASNQQFVQYVNTLNKNILSQVRNTYRPVYRKVKMHPEKIESDMVAILKSKNRYCQNLSFVLSKNIKCIKKTELQKQEEKAKRKRIKVLFITTAIFSMFIYLFFS